MKAHLREAGGGRRMRSIISIFGPASATHAPCVIESGQILQYAGYLQPNGQVIGDREGIERVRMAESLGWRRPAMPGPHDLLPLVIRDSDGRRRLYPIPQELAFEVRITHPQHDRISALGIRWYSIPCVSDMILTIGGIDYPCAPFNGHYMVTEIASRNLVDARRYDLLPQVADALGLDRGADPLWRDGALTELNRAVMHSFREAGAHIVDHHHASAQYMDFVAQEQRHGRSVAGDWMWLLPPQAAAASPLFHLPMNDIGAVPNFYRSRQIDGAHLRINDSHERRGRWHERYRRIRARWRNWRRRRDFNPRG